MDATGQSAVPGTFIVENAPAILPKNRVQALDGLRGIAILLVLVYHLHEYIPRLWPQLTAFGESGFVSQALSFGWIGVDLFYVLSGFFIGGAVLRPANWNPRHFFAGRISRIIPAYYASILFTLLLLQPKSLLSIHVMVDVLLHMVMLHNLQEGTMFSINGPYWTLAVEFSFYMLMLALAPFWRLARGWLLVPAFIAVSLIWKASLMTGVEPAKRFFLNSQLPGALDEFALGMLVAYLFATFGRKIAVQRSNKAAVGVIAAGVLVVAAMVHHFTHLTVDYWSHAPTVMWARLGLCCGFGMVLAGFVLLRDSLMFTNIFKYTGMAALGRMSYSVYLLHIPIILFLHHQFQDTFASAGLAFSALCTVLILAAAALSFHTIERRWHPAA